MIFVDTVDVVLRVWEGGAKKRIRQGAVTFEERIGFHSDTDISLDALVEFARTTSLRASGNIGGGLTVSHTGSNEPRAGSFVAIELELVGEPDDAAWHSILEQIASAIRESIWSHH